MKFLQRIKDCFFPHEGNSHKPTLLCEEGIAVVVMATILIVAFSLSGRVAVDSKVLSASVQSLVLVDLTNKNRKENDVPTLAVNLLLVRAAELKVNDMAAKSYFAHTSPEGITPWYWFSQSGYSFLYAGENLAVNYSESIDVDDAWMNSPAHRANILNGNFTEIGIATAEGIYKGKKTTFVVQMFGSQKARAPVTSAPENSPLFAKIAVSVTPVSSDVLGETASEPEKIDVIYANDTYISVKNADPETVVSEAEAGLGSFDAPDENAKTETYTNFLQRIVVNSGYYARILLTILLGIVAVTLILMVIIEIKKQHYKNILYGVLVVILLILILALSRDLLFQSPVVL